MAIGDMAITQSRPAPAAGGRADMSALNGVGSVLPLIGAGLGAIGSFYDALAARGTLRSQALSADYESSIASLNARSAEQEANTLLLAGDQEIGRLTMRTGAVHASQAADAASRGVQVGVGSQAEIMAGTRYAEQADSIQIHANAVREANAQRARQVQAQNEQQAASLSAQRYRRAASSINPWIAAGTSLLGGSSQVASQWLYRSRA